MEIEISKNYSVRRLQQWLDYELSTFILILFSWFVHIALLLMIIAAVIFTPFMLKVMFEERRFGWILFFFLMVILPAASIFIFNIGSTFKSVIELIPLALFYFYCFVLRLVIKDW